MQWEPGGAKHTLVVVLAPHEDAAPVREVVGHDGQPVPPGLHHRLHVVQAGVPAQTGRLQARVDLRRLLELNDLLGRLCGGREGVGGAGGGHVRTPGRYSPGRFRVNLCDL